MGSSRGHIEVLIRTVCLNMIKIYSISFQEGNHNDIPGAACVFIFPLIQSTIELKEEDSSLIATDCIVQSPLKILVDNFYQ